MIDWAQFQAGMEAARKGGELGSLALLSEIQEVGGPLPTEFEGHPDWHLGYDHAIRLARR
ncbi:MAG: hypothetical protein AAGC81_20445 [Pseudomonadota bacterium]